MFSLNRNKLFNKEKEKVEILSLLFYFDASLHQLMRSNLKKYEFSLSKNEQKRSTNDTHI